MHKEFHMTPTEGDISEMKRALSSDETVAKFTEEQKEKLYSGMLTIKRMYELHEDFDEVTHSTKRMKYARRLQTSLERVIEVLNEKEGRAHFFQALAKMRDALGLTSPGIVEVATDFEITARRLLQASKQARPRKATSPPPNRPTKALGEVRMTKNLLEGLGVSIGATGGETGGPATRLMAKIHEYVSGSVTNPEAIKDRLMRLKEWEASHPGGQPAS
jgi:hypothetical protein